MFCKILINKEKLPPEILESHFLATFGKQTSSLSASALNIILIDYESLQPADLAGLEGEDVRVLVFVGAQQNRIPFDFAEAMQQLGERARYVKIGGTGRNALDFHLAFYLGELTQQYPGGAFRIVSKDSGFDPLIAHLQGRGFDVERCQALPAQIRDPEEQVT